MIALLIASVLVYGAALTFALRMARRRTDALVARIRARPVVARYVSNGVEIVHHGFPRDTDD